jgi:hypothetical protein
MAKQKYEVKQLQNLTIVTPEGEKATVFIGKSCRMEERFVMMFQQSLVNMAVSDFPSRPMRVFLYLCGKMDFENMVHVPQMMIAEGLSMDQANVSRAIQYLQNKEFLIPGPKVGNSKTYKMNNSVCWRGKASSLKKERLTPK